MEITKVIRKMGLKPRRFTTALIVNLCCNISQFCAEIYSMIIKNMAKNHCLAKSINDASWYQFRIWIEYFGKVFERVTVAVNPQYTSSYCSSCGEIVKKTLSTRTHVCRCGCAMDRNENAARNILSRGLSTVGLMGTFMLDMSNALGESTSTRAGEILFEQVGSVNKESPRL
ncbi:Putative transposase in snaA-snaB intergenic region [Planktothrix agardhii]|nr:Putative transposase in snaA-snaB intergenic region [Planktothrix rubescens NIVA-CYA 18]CAD5954478.1 Putative transposase in snaA-snaB intergenic region [Planktothrix agardhii]